MTESLPDDVQHWLDLPDDESPFYDEGLSFDPESAAAGAVDTSYLSAEELAANADLAANVAAMADTAGLITWVALDEDSNYLGLWRGPANLPLTQAPAVVLTSEGQFELLSGRTFTEAVCDHLAYGDEEEWDTLVQAVREAGGTVEATGFDDLPEPMADPTPSDFHQERYRHHLGE